jgi:prophage DNA circulation protein
LIPKISADKALSQKAIQDLLDSFVKDAGVLERQKKYWAVKKVFDALNLPNPPSWISSFLKTMSDAITLQMSVDLSSSITDTGTSVFSIFAGTSLDAGAAAETVQSNLAEQISAVQQQATQLGQSISSVVGQIGSMTKQIFDVSSQVAVHSGKFEQVATLNQNVSSVQKQVSALNNFKVLDIPVDVKNLQTELGSLWTAVNNIKK